MADMIRAPRNGEVVELLIKGIWTKGHWGPIYYVRPKDDKTEGHFVYGWKCFGTGYSNEAPIEWRYIKN